MSPVPYRAEPPASPYGADALSALPPPTHGRDVGGWATRVAYAIAAIAVLLELFANFNPEFGFFLEKWQFDARHWPWELFQRDGSFVFEWRPGPAWIASLAIASAALLVAVFLRSGRARALCALLAVVLLTTTLLHVDPKTFLAAGLNLSQALLAGAVVASAARPRHEAAQRMVGMSLLMLVLLLLLPIPTPSDVPVDEGPRPYASVASTTVQIYADKLGIVPLPLPPAGMDTPLPQGTWRELLVTSGRNVAWILAALVGLLSLLGLRGWWAAWAMGLLLLVHVVGDPWLWAWSEIDGVNERNGPGNTLPWSKALTDGATIAASRAMYWFDLSLIPLALGLADGLRGPRRRT